MTAGGVGLALLLQGSHGAHGGRAAAAATAAAAAAAGIAAAAAAEGWLELPRHRNPFVARANAATAAAPQRSMCPLGFRVGEDPKAMYKTYPYVELPAVLSTLGPRNLSWVYIKNQALVAILALNSYFYEVLEAEEAALESGTAPVMPPFPEVGPMLDRALNSTARELLTTLVRRVYEHAWRARASPRWAWKVLKSWRESVTRKATWYLEAGPLALWPSYTRTAARCTALAYAADFTVSTAYSAAAVFRSPAAPRAPAARARLLARFAWQHAARCAVTWAAAAAGAAAVACAAPRESAGWYAGFAHLFIDMAVGNGVIFLLFDHAASAPAGAGGKAEAAAGGAAGGGGSAAPVEELVLEAEVAAGGGAGWGAAQ